MSTIVAFSDHTSLRLPVAFARQLPGHAKKATAVVLPDLRKSFSVEVGWTGQPPRQYHTFSSGWSKVVQAAGFREGDTLRVEYVSNVGTYYISKVSNAAAGGAADPIGACHAVPLFPSLFSHTLSACHVSRALSAAAGAAAEVSLCIALCLLPMSSLSSHSCARSVVPSPSVLAYETSIEISRVPTLLRERTAVMTGLTSLSPF